MPFCFGLIAPGWAPWSSCVCGRPEPNLTPPCKAQSADNDMKAIVIGAGRGRRLMPTTADTPKCYAEVQGRRLLDWALAAFAEAGLRDICFIGGYQIEKVRRDYPQFTFRHNTGWEHNNILLSLMHAEDLMSEG